MRYLRNTFLPIALVLLLVTSAFGAITFTYTEATNKVVQTEGTSGTSATFANFVTFDRAGAGTVLLAPTVAGTGITLTYQVRPVELRALNLNFIVASKTPAQTDYIYIEGTDAWDVAQTEVIDVTAGDDTYPSVEKWRTITGLWCTDAVDGSGNIWADGTISVEQDIWGVIWDKGNKQYQLDCHFTIGNGVATTYFASVQDTVYGTTGMNFPVVTSLATCTIGSLYSGGSYLGSYWNVSPSAALTVIDTGVTGTLNVYSSIIHNRSFRFWFLGGTIALTDVLLTHGYYSIGANGDRHWAFESGVSSLTINNAYIADSSDITINCVATINGLYMNRCYDALHSTYFSGTATVTNLVATNIGNKTFSTWTYGEDAPVTLIAINPTVAVISTSNGGSTQSSEIIKFTCDINVCGKDGGALQSVVVDCEDQFGTAVWAAGTITTDASGDIAQQLVIYRIYLGTTPTLTTYSPHKFTLSKAGYVTQVHEAITVNGAIGSATKPWHIEMQPIGYPPSPWIIGMLGMLIVATAVTTYKKRRFFH